MTQVTIQTMPVREEGMLPAWDRIFLSMGHRLASMGILVFVLALAGVVAGQGVLGETARASMPPRTYGALLVGTFLLADLSSIAGFLAWRAHYNFGRGLREPMGLVAVSVGLMMAATTLLFMAKHELLSKAVGNVLRLVGM